MNRLERRDDFFKGAVAGMIGAVVKYGFNELMQFLQIAKYDNNATAITVVFTQYERSPSLLDNRIHSCFVNRCVFRCYYRFYF